MTLQILALALYNRKGERRELRFRPGRVNVITGASKTGKSALIDIVDYCLGRNDYTIPSGVIRDSVVWYALHIQLLNTQAIIGRPAPHDSDTTSAVFFQTGNDLPLPEFGSLHPNSNTTALEQFLTEAVGIGANENVPPEGQSRLALQANIRHARLLLFQPQSRIADRNLMFYRQEVPFLPQAIKDTLPYFLGASGDDRYESLQLLRRLRRDLRIVERRMADEQALRGQDNSRATAFVAEALNVGLLTPGTVAGELEEALTLLRGIANWTPAKDESVPGNTLNTLQEEREGLLAVARTTQNEIDAARSFAAAEEGFTVEATDQKNRLTSLGLYRDEPGTNKCPLCENELNGAVPKAEAIQKSLASLEKQVNATNRQRPRLEAFLGERENRLGDLRRRIRENKASIEALVAQEEALQRERNRTIEQARVVGRIGLFLESVKLVQTDNALQARALELQGQIATLEADLSDEVVEDRLNSILQVVGRDMTGWARIRAYSEKGVPLGAGQDKVIGAVGRQNGTHGWRVAYGSACARKDWTRGEERC